MRSMRKRPSLLCALGLLAALALSAAGCRSTFQSGLPDDIRTVEVHIFQNKTMYHDVEARVARDIIDRINMDPAVRVASNGGDAVLTGEITAVRRATVRETTANEPGAVQITIEATYSFYDNRRRRFIVEEATISSSDTGMSQGLYEASRGDVSEGGERAAAKALAGEIVRRTVGMW